MAAPGEESWYAQGTEAQNPQSGEYPYRSDDLQGIYADAHYEPAAETTVPPRYYTPRERPEKVRPARQREKRKIRLGAAIALCLICAMLGGMLGSGIFYSLTEKRIDAVEQALAATAQAAQQNTDTVDAVGEWPGVRAGSVVNNSGALPAAQVYEQACGQVVGITSTVTTTNFFGMTSSGAVSGSGFVLSEDGYIITNYHVIEYADKGGQAIKVILHDGTEYEASIVGKEEINDLAVLKIEATGLSPVSAGDSDAIRVGDEVYAVGNPLGELEFSMSTGHVSALNRVVSTEEAEAINMFQIDAAVNPGNSGGPVYNDRGEVIGVVTAKYSDSGVEGLGFAIPINDAIRIAEDLVTNGYVTGKAYLGVWMDERYNSMAAQYFNMPLGAYISKVEPGSAAAKAGLESGDIITAIDDVTVETYAELRTAIREYSAGDSATLTVYRAGESKSVTVIFDERTPESGTKMPGGED